MDTSWYDRFEASLQSDLLELCARQGWLQGRIMECDDLNRQWKRLAPEYMPDAVAQFNAYPLATLAWPGYMGMAEAALWDEDWERNRSFGYAFLHGGAGFDTLDERVLRDLLHMEPDSAEARQTDNRLERLATLANDRLRHEGAEPGSADAFYLFSRALKAMYRVGVALELQRRGYHWEKME